MKSYLTSFGIPGIAVVPYGIHMCHFYPSREELIAGLIPYISAGLANNERCLWLASAPLPVSEIGDEIADASDLAMGLASGQLMIADAVEWYGELEKLAVEESVRRLIDEEERALADGFNGLRVAGNTSFVPRAAWDRFMEYENKLHEQLKSRRILVCCSYQRAGCQAVDILDVVHRHDGAVDRPGQHWEFLLASRDKAGKFRAPSDGQAQGWASAPLTIASFP
ncbi:MAG TPA: MEDS domain-containing protein [Rhizomicrobium sp.]